MYWKQIGPKTEPCGTPYSTADGIEERRSQSNDELCTPTVGVEADRCPKFCTGGDESCTNCVFRRKVVPTVELSLFDKANISRTYVREYSCLSAVNIITKITVSVCKQNGLENDENANFADREKFPVPLVNI